MLAIVQSLLIAVAVISLCQGQRNILPDPASARLLKRYNKYYAYTRFNSRTAYTLENSEASADASHIRSGRMTIFLIHGQGVLSEPNVIMRETILRHHDANVIVVDWSIIALAARKPQHLARYMGLPLGELIKFLANTHRPYIQLQRTHLVGFGAGAHIAGVAARYVKETLDIVGRITALDPFIVPDPADKLLKDDAKYVEVIHTDGFGQGALAIGNPVGHVDFYPNGGSHPQPGCTTHTCSHHRAWELFEATLEKTSTLMGSKCEKFADMTANKCHGTGWSLGGLSFPDGSNQY